MPPALGGVRPPHDRNHAAETTEVIIEYLNPNSLRQFSRKDLLALSRELILAMAALPEGAPERHVAVTNLANIRWALSQMRPVPR